jgi:hypothetical protein
MRKRRLKRADPPAFSPRFVAFLDILGFEELVRKADTDLSARRTIRSAIGILRGANNDRKDSGYQFTHFSDSIVLSADVSDVGARAIIESCCRLYVLLLRRGLLLRGGLTVGNVIHETNGMLYGSAMIEAYRMDQRGIPPRISLTDLACEAIDTVCTDAFKNRYVRADDYDLSSMIHVLQEFARIRRPGPKRALAEKLPTANDVALIVSQQAANQDLPADVRAKWRWLRGYWNSAMTKHGLVSLAA